MWKPLTLSQIFSQSLWPFFQTPSPQSAQLMPIVKSLCFLFFKHTLNSFSLIHSIWLLMLSWSNNMFSISTFLITSKTPSLLQNKKNEKTYWEVSEANISPINQNSEKSSFTNIPPQQHLSLPIVLLCSLCQNDILTTSQTQKQPTFTKI